MTLKDNVNILRPPHIELFFSSFLNFKNTYVIVGINWSWIDREDNPKMDFIVLIYNLYLKVEIWYIFNCVNYVKINQT